ncbi:transposase IS66 (plasmid) [Tolypothrix tenuis PCC 7101]|uniref:Transposase IS66 n=1 Tax=Tolypothrix tenuis PCC 7101 TaxID=231146 RepID=A0A1Z4NBU4_9CYAN|nr:IS66 family transposase [Aulosira sp. FACHB-113]BAZ03191.1 transposase IS66 [Tolypothrix tenuis PCC 7101]BAZ78536.1 transposase IS66 [Aulosira laxa NIES-50]
MDENCLAYGIEISDSDWEKTPASVKQLVEKMEQYIKESDKRFADLEAKYQELLEKINRTSKNSSSAPSSDPLNTEKQKQKNKSDKKRGGQPGHKGHSRHLYEVSECESVLEHHPETCNCCGEKLVGVDSNPYRHQIVEIPPINPIIVEHRLHQLECRNCGTLTRAKLPQDVATRGYGVRVVALVAVLSGLYRHSTRMVQSAMQDIFGITMCLGTVNKLKKEASDAIESAVWEAKTYVQNSPVVGADETSFSQGNVDGFNQKNRKAWLWVAVTPLVTFFQITLSRCTVTAKNLLGEKFGGILNSDRYASYNWVSLEQRQLCWAHLKREFIKISERTGVSHDIGNALVQQQEKLFELWHRIRDGTLSRDEFRQLVTPIRDAIKSSLQEAADYKISSQEKTPLAKTVRTCRQLLKVEPALWLFVTVEGVEPTNNAAERAIRPAVIWRRTSFGSQTQGGSNFVARMLTVVTTLKSQRRNVLEFMTQAVSAKRQSQPTPSLLPHVPVAVVAVKNAA